MAVGGESWVWPRTVGQEEWPESTRDINGLGTVSKYSVVGESSNGPTRIKEHKMEAVVASQPSQVKWSSGRSSGQSSGQSRWRCCQHRHAVD